MTKSSRNSEIGRMVATQTEMLENVKLEYTNRYIEPRSYNI